MGTETTTELISLKEIGITKSDLAIFVADYANLVVTKETIKDAKKARQLVREKRFEIQNFEESNNDQLNKLKKQNKSNAAELIAVLAPTESMLDAGIKLIEEAEAKEKAEKAKALEAKVVRRGTDLINAGAEFNGARYFLNAVSVPALELRNITDDVFENLLNDFNAEFEKKQFADNRYRRISGIGYKEALDEFSYPADLFPDSAVVYGKASILGMTEDEFDAFVAAREKEIADKKDAIRAEKQKLLDQKNLVKGRQQKLFDLGATFDGGNYRYGACHLITSLDVEQVTEDKWNTEIASIEAKITFAKETEANQRSAADKLAEENRLLLEARTKSRASVLLGLGLSLSGTSYVFHEIQVSKIQVEQLLDIEWDGLVGLVTGKAATKKAEIEAQASAEQKRIEALRSEKEHLQIFVDNLYKITGPELKTEQGREIVDRCIAGIHAIAKGLNEEIATL